MKRILPLTLLVLVFYTVRRLNRLIAGVEAQKAQLETLQAQTEALRATLETQRAAMDAMRTRIEASENAIFGDAAERMARWNEKLADLDSLN